MHIALVLAAAWAGAVAGDNIGFAIGRFGGRRLVTRSGAGWGSRKRGWRGRSGSSGATAGRCAAARFMPLLRHVEWNRGRDDEMPWWRFRAYNAAGAALWVGFWGTLAYEVSKRAGGLAEAVEGHETQLVLGVAAVLLTGWLVYMIIRRRRNEG